jgi:AlwI restriction endonuclease
MGNTTARNPMRLRPALQLFIRTMSGRPFRESEQQEFLNELVAVRLVDSDRTTGGSDGGRKFASAFKPLGFVTDWSRGKPWTITPVGQTLLNNPELEEVIFLRQLLKYQIPSPLESGRRVVGFHVRPFRLLLRFLYRAREEDLGGLTKFEMALYVITMLDEDDNTAFETAIANIKQFRTHYKVTTGKVRKNEFAKRNLVTVANGVGLEPGSLFDYADSNGRYALMTGLLTTRGNKLTLSDTRLPVTKTILSDGTTLVLNDGYLEWFYNPNEPLLPTDDEVFLRNEIADLERRFTDLATHVGEPTTLPTPPLGMTVSDLQAYEIRLRERLRDVREIQFYQTQRTLDALNEIEDLLEDIMEGTGAFFGGLSYAPAFLEWAIWRIFLAINEIIVPISKTRGFQIDEDMNPIHHAKGGAADLTFTYNTFKLVCEMTLATGSRQFAMEGEPVTRHVFKAIENSKDGKPVYGLFVTKELDPNTAYAFHHARYWRNWRYSVPTPIVALRIKDMIELVRHMKSHPVTSVDIRQLLDSILNLQDTHPNGPSWYEAYSKTYESWLRERT